MESECLFAELLERAVNFAKHSRVLDSRHILRTIPKHAWNQRYYLAHAICCMKQEDFRSAVEYLEPIRDTLDHKSLKVLSKCYEKLNDNPKAAEVYLQMNPEEMKFAQWIKMLNCFQKLADETKVDEIFTTILERFPDNHLICFRYADYLLENDHPSFLVYIDCFINKWPLQIKFHLLKIQHALAHQRTDGIENYLISILHQHPFLMHANFLLMEYYLLSQMPMMVQLYQRSCINRMSASGNLAFELNAFNDRYKELKEIVILRAPAKVTLSTVVQRSFETCQAGDVGCYLVGSAVHNLINQSELSYLQDLDFVSNRLPNKKCFIANPHIRNLYTCWMTEEFGSRKKIDYFVVGYPHETFLKQDFLTRDFTINALYVDRHGNLSDPSGLGYPDFMDKTLRTIGLPSKSLAEDPNRILRALKLMAQGYRPVEELDFALANWVPDYRFNQAHLYSITRKILDAINPLAFINYLKQYQLLSKLFLLSEHTSDEQALEALRQLIMPKVNRFFVCASVTPSLALTHLASR